ncbi:hypothetical protein K7X08_027746 [Anisodus acutangulus]|uniref:Uncharacterized protein n=1 Tax=Anisodus acutangulus TaxID=402998 RepID=A0A9Q1R3H9_9SOLA|nr:hypothetical protein K7X08_027746 [Anisodus acutangulus]
MKSVNAIQGLAPLEFQLPGEKRIVEQTPLLRSGGSNKNQSSGSALWGDIAEEDNLGQKQGTPVMEEVKTPSGQSPTWSDIVGSVPSNDGMDLIAEAASATNVKITLEDIKEEVAGRIATVGFAKYQLLWFI